MLEDMQKNSTKVFVRLTAQISSAWVVSLNPVTITALLRYSPPFTHCGGPSSDLHILLLSSFTGKVLRKDAGRSRSSEHATNNLHNELRMVSATSAIAVRRTIVIVI